MGNFIIENGEDLMIPIFFVAGFVLMLALAAVYFFSKEKTFKLFGIGIFLDAIAFGIWAYMSIFRPENLTAITNVGVLIFFASFAIFAMVVLSTLKGKVRMVVSILTAALLATLLLMRFIFVKSNPHFLDSGLFSFGVEPAVMYIYVVVSSFTILPAAYIVADKVKKVGLKTMIQFGFTLMVIGITVLLTSENRELQTMNGYGMISGLLLAAVGQIAYALPAIMSPNMAAKPKKIKK